MWCPGAVAALVAGNAAQGRICGASALLLLVMWPAGLLAGVLEDAVDWPAFRWAEGIVADLWWRIHDVVTRMGNTTQIRIATVAGAVALAALLARVIAAVRLADPSPSGLAQGCGARSADSGV